MLSGLFGTPLAAGTPAPGFSLPDQRGRTVTLSELRGRNVILFFYPGDDTPT
jgi:peroxiredoxin Q/BCP